MDDIRIRIIEQVCRLSESYLPAVEAHLHSLKPSPIVQPATIATDHKPWPHAPVHRVSENGTYFVTASTLDKAHLFGSPDRLTFLEDRLLAIAHQFAFHLEAWAVFSNHYHIVGHVGTRGEAVGPMIARLHSDTASEINRQDGTPGRQVWQNYWDSSLTFEASYLSRLHYTHHNAVKHGLVEVARDYLWCSAAWFERTATTAQVKTIYSFKIDRLKVEDEYEPI